ncbi:MAG: HEPN domain-containing protein [Verrucomicrobia bacterium]|nr:HEPN domain-containing protein [Verrucomicrobiota bacterium]
MAVEFMRGRPDNPADWYAFARRDLEKAKKDLAAGESLYAVLLLQQASEKLLKGKLVDLGENPEKTHNLPYLITRIGVHGNDFERFRKTAEFLSYEYLAERYPGDFDPPPTDAEASEALADVMRLFDLIDPLK